MNIYRIAFAGHQKIKRQPLVITQIESALKELLYDKECVELFFGRNSDFEFLAALAAKLVKTSLKNNRIQLVLVQPYYNEDDFLFERLFDEIRYPIKEKDENVAIIKRNQWMVDNADLLVAYVEKASGDDSLFTLQYAEEKGVQIINLFGK